jgi:phenylalanyl-tRNA synthetase beta chain
VFISDPSVVSGELQVKGVDQPWRIAAIAFGSVAPEQWGLPQRLVDFHDVKGDLEALCAGLTLEFCAAVHPALHPGRSAQIFHAGQAIGWIGEMHPALQQQLELSHPPVLFELELEPLKARSLAMHADASKFPPVLRDIALLVPVDMPAARVRESIAKAVGSGPGAGLVQAVVLFDEYRGKGLENKEKSLAFRLWMQDTSRTLGDAEVQQVIQSVVAGVARDIGARLRAGA